MREKNNFWWVKKKKGVGVVVGRFVSILVAKDSVGGGVGGCAM